MSTTGLKKRDYLPIRPLMEAFGSFTIARVVDELQRITPKNKHPRSYLVARVAGILQGVIKQGLVERTASASGLKSYRWVSHPIRSEDLPLGYRLPPTPAPPIDLDDHKTKASQYWDNAAGRAKA